MRRGVKINSKYLTKEPLMKTLFFVFLLSSSIASASIEKFDTVMNAYRGITAQLMFKLDNQGGSLKQEDMDSAKVLFRSALATKLDAQEVDCVLKNQESFFDFRRMLDFYELTESLKGINSNVKLSGEILSRTNVEPKDVVSAGRSVNDLLVRQLALLFGKIQEDQEKFRNETMSNTTGCLKR